MTCFGHCPPPLYFLQSSQNDLKKSRLKTFYLLPISLGENAQVLTLAANSYVVWLPLRLRFRKFSGLGSLHSCQIGQIHCFSNILGESVSNSVVCDSLQPHGLQPGSCVHGILQARILEWVAISFSILGELFLNSLHFLLFSGSPHLSLRVCVLSFNHQFLPAFTKMSPSKWAHPI